MSLRICFISPIDVAVAELFLGIILQTEHSFVLISTKLAASQRIIISQHIT